MEEEIKRIIKMYQIPQEQFDKILKQTIRTMTFGKIPETDEKKKMYLIGGQPGAGKTRLIQRIIYEIENQHYGEQISKNIEFSSHSVQVDFDILRATHPYYDEVRENYPEIVHRVLHSYTEELKARIIDYLIENKFNVVYEGVLRTAQGYKDLLSQFKQNGYTVEMDLMAVPYLESLGSTYTRYVMELQNDRKARWVEKGVHDDAYKGIIENTRKLFSQEGPLNEKDRIRVFVRGEEEPVEIYPTEKNDQFDLQQALDAVKRGRESGRREAMNSFPLKHGIVTLILKDKKPELIPQLKGWEKVYDNEVQYFSKLSLQNFNENER